MVWSLSSKVVVLVFIIFDLKNVQGLVVKEPEVSYFQCADSCCVSDFSQSTVCQSVSDTLLNLSKIDPTNTRKGSVYNLSIVPNIIKYCKLTADNYN